VEKGPLREKWKPEGFKDEEKISESLFRLEMRSREEEKASMKFLERRT